MRTNPARWLLVLMLVAALAVLVSACGGSSSSSSSGSETTTESEAEGGGEKEAEGEEGESEEGESSGGADIAELEKIVKEHVEPQGIGPTTKITKKVPEDQYAVFINCGAPACVVFEESFNEAAKVFNWKVDDITVEPTPASIQAGFGEAVRRKPDAVVTSGFAIEQFPKQAKELNELEIPILSNTGTDPATFNPAEGVTLQTQEPKVVSEAAALMADQAIVNAGGEGTFLAANLSGYPSVKIQVEGFEEEIKTKCPNCSVERLEVQPTQLGKEAPTIVANKLRQNPDIVGIYFGYDAIATGLNSALKTAGITPPDTYSWAPDEVGVEELRNDEKTGAVPLGQPENGWQMVYAMALMATGGNVEDAEQWGPYVLWAPEFENIPDSPANPPPNPDYKEEFEKLWGTK
jgi:ABC-type sugar transport system substrate-binding protein